MQLKVGIIGLGLMGLPISTNILKGGFPLYIYNRTKSKATGLVASGAILWQTPAEVAHHVDILITVVTAATDVEQVLFNKDGVIYGANSGLVVIDMSTIGPKAATVIAARLTEHGISFLDAPITGGTSKAQSGELTMFVGGDEKELARIKPVLTVVAKNIIHMGPTGYGQAIKLMNNYLLAANTAALAECMTLADTLHISRQKVADALKQTPTLPDAAIPKLDNFVNQTYLTSFSLANMTKDVTLAQQAVADAGIGLPGVHMTALRYQEANKDLTQSRQDFSIILEEIEKRAKST